MKNKESIMRDISTIACASSMIPLSIALAFIGEYECALLGIFSKADADGEEIE